MKFLKSAEQQLDRWFAALKTCDPDQVVALYAPDSILLSTYKGDVKKGRRKIRAYFAKDFLPKKPIGTAVESYTRLFGEIAVNSGLYGFQVDSKNAGRVTVVARYTFVYRWLGDDWKIIEHHSSLNPESAPTNAKTETADRSGKSAPKEPTGPNHALKGSRR